MAETFYTALGIGEDADADAIQAAYRERVKERHPDVSDDPDAPRAFSRLTTARSVLVDEDERARYDRLGHDTYVTRHLDTAAWTPVGDVPATDTTTSPDATGTASSGVAGGDPRRGTGDRSTWLGEDWEGPRERGGPRGEAASAATAGWQHASDVYRRSPTTGPSTRGGASDAAGTLGAVVRSLGPWLVVHVVFLVTAVGTAWYAYASLGAVSRFSLPGMAFGVVIVALVFTLSVLHVVSLLN